MLTKGNSSWWTRYPGEMNILHMREKCWFVGGLRQACDRRKRDESSLTTCLD